jgi:hypothetical protein
MKKIEIRPSELKKVSIYTEELRKCISRSKEIGLEKALKEWSEEIKKRRLAWFKQHKNSLNLQGTEVRKGFQLVIFEYMGIDPKEVDIIDETDKKITYRCYNFCPYFEAIKNLKMDSKIVCSQVTEAPIQSLLDVINPHLRLSRNYKNIRPYTEYCEESIELID